MSQYSRAFPAGAARLSERVTNKAARSLNECAASSFFICLLLVGGTEVRNDDVNISGVHF